MPTYEFKCYNGHVTEKVLSIKDDTQEVLCDFCEMRPVMAKRIISRSSFQFKTGGFYYTDYVRNNTTAGSED